MNDQQAGLGIVLQLMTIIRIFQKLDMSMYHFRIIACLSTLSPLSHCFTIVAFWHKFEKSDWNALPRGILLFVAMLTSIAYGGVIIKTFRIPGDFDVRCSKPEDREP